MNSIGTAGIANTTIPSIIGNIGNVNEKKQHQYNHNLRYLPLVFLKEYLCGCSCRISTTSMFVTLTTFVMCNTSLYDMYIVYHTYILLST